jgi:5'-methylthioadenosine/S-adenosylhomocysteine nucleosidase
MRLVLLAAEPGEAKALARQLGLEQVREESWLSRYGLFERHEVTLVEAGVGKVAAASACAWAITRWQPQALVWAGLAGSLREDLKPLEVLVAHEALQWDVDLSAFGRAPGELPDGSRWIATDPELSQLLLKAAQSLGISAHLGRVLSGDRFIQGPEREALRRFGGDVAEMEGAAALWVARRFGVPFALVRVISDGIQEGPKAFQERFAAASEELSELLAHFLRMLR